LRLRQLTLAVALEARFARPTDSCPLGRVSSSFALPDLAGEGEMGKAASQRDDQEHPGRGPTMDEPKLLERITVNPSIFGGKPILRGRRLAVEHVLGMLAAGDTPEILLQGYPWLEREDIQACLVYARRLVGHERIEPLKIESAA